MWPSIRKTELYNIVLISLQTRKETSGVKIKTKIANRAEPVMQKKHLYQT